MAKKEPTASTRSSASGKSTKPPQPATRSAKETRDQKSSVTLEELTREIAVRAHEIFEERIAAGLPGDDLSDWLAAEAEIKKKHKLP